MDKLQHFFTSSSILFGVALVIIIGTGMTLVVTLENFEEKPALSSEFVSTRSDETVALSTTKQTEANRSEVVTAQEVAETASSETATISCLDCVYAAVDKDRSLSATYIPQLVQVDLAGGGQLTSKAHAALKKLFSAAQNEGTEAQIISAYRSFAQQASTFKYWVSTEKAGGLSQAEAEAQANTYSARPGHSEHQLGTTVDLSCKGCQAFSEEQNKNLYAFIKKQAHKYGFVVSYPEGMQAQTGYTSEPWHIRWVGVDLATELFETGYIDGNGNYLTKLLREKGLSE